MTDGEEFEAALAKIFDAAEIYEEETSQKRTLGEVNRQRGQR